MSPGPSIERTLRTPLRALTTNIRGIIVGRKEPDGRWRVAQELLHAEPIAK